MRRLLAATLLALVVSGHAATAADQPYIVKQLPVVPAWLYYGWGGGLGVLGGRMWFVERDDPGVWWTDGTPVGTRKVFTTGTGACCSIPLPTAGEGLVIGSRLYFATVAISHVPAGQPGDVSTLWVTDGTAQGVVDLGQATSTDSCGQGRQVGFRNLTDVGGALDFFRNAGPSPFSTPDYSLWTSNGTVAGTLPVASGSGGCALGPSGLAGSRLYFTSTSVGGTELFAVDLMSNTTSMVADVSGPSLDSAVKDPTPFGGQLYFTAIPDQPQQRRLYRTDGTVAGTQAVHSFATGIGSTVPGLVAAGGYLYFSVGANELWRTNGTTATLIGMFTNLQRLAAWGDRLLFVAQAASRPGLWVVSAGGTATFLGDFQSVGQPSPAKPFSFQGAYAYFACSDGAYGAELCRTDGTPAGTGLVADVVPGPDSSNAYPVLATPALQFFVANEGTPSSALWAIGATPVVSVGDVTVTEPLAGTTTATFTVEVAPVPTSTVTVGYRTVDGTATAGSDYDAVQGLLTFNPGVATQTVNVTVRRDFKFGSDATFFLELFNATGATIVTPRGTGTIQEVDGPPTLVVADVSAAEGTGTGGVALVTLALSAPSEVAASVSYATMDVDAVAGPDYQAKSGTATFPAGTTSLQVAIPLVGDSLDEPNESFQLIFANPQNLVLPAHPAQVTVLDDDGRAAICQPITYLPYTISAQGRYCLVRNLSTMISSGAAISIESDFVHLDLQGFKIGGGSAGFGTTADGVRATGRRNVTVHSGNIRGFLRGVALVGASSAAHVVRDLRLDENTLAAVVVEGSGHVVKGNHVVATGGTTTATDATTWGIRAIGPGMRVLGNDVTDTLPVGSAEGRAIGLENAGGAVVEGNRVGIESTAPGTVGIDLSSGTNQLVLKNRISRTSAGIRFGGGATGLYRGNVTAGVGTPYSGGTDGGGNQ